MTPRVLTTPTIADRFAPRRNSLNFLRLVFAGLVIVTHGWEAAGYGLGPTIGGLGVGEWGVVGFFAVSGYLISKSRLRNPLGDYMAHRILRVYPAYVVCLAITATAFASLSTQMDGGVVHWPSAMSYVIKNLLLKNEQGGIAATLTHTPSGSSWWNISLWTLFYEFLCYVVIGLLLTAALRYHRPLVIAAFVVCSVAAALTSDGYPVSNSTVDRFVWLAAFFFGGALMALYADRIPLNGRVALIMCVLLAVTAAADLRLAPLLGSIPAAYLVLYLGAALPFSPVGAVNDISYGMYIYAFPVQQLITAMHRETLPIAVSIAIAAVATVPLAAASWFFVERPVMIWGRRWLDSAAGTRARRFRPRASDRGSRGAAVRRRLQGTAPHDGPR